MAIGLVGAVLRVGDQILPSSVRQVELGKPLAISQGSVQASLTPLDSWPMGTSILVRLDPVYTGEQWEISAMDAPQSKIRVFRGMEISHDSLVVELPHLVWQDGTGWNEGIGLRALLNPGHYLVQVGTETFPLDLPDTRPLIEADRTAAVEALRVQELKKAGRWFVSSQERLAARARDASRVGLGKRLWQATLGRIPLFHPVPKLPTPLPPSATRIWDFLVENVGFPDVTIAVVYDPETSEIIAIGDKVQNHNEPVDFDEEGRPSQYSARLLKECIRELATSHPGKGVAAIWIDNFRLAVSADERSLPDQLAALMGRYLHELAPEVFRPK